MDLQAKVKKLATDHPELRKHLVPLLGEKTAAGNTAGALVKAALVKYLQLVQRAGKGDHVDVSSGPGQFEVGLANPFLSPGTNGWIIAYVDFDFDRDTVTTWCFCYDEGKDIEYETGQYKMTLGSFFSNTAQGYVKYIYKIVKDNFYR